MSTLPEDRIRPESTVLLIIDVQNDFCAEDGWMGSRGFDLTDIHRAVESIQTLLPEARKAGVRPIFVRAHYDRRYLSEVTLERMRRDNGEVREHCREGTWGAGFFRVEPAQGDEVVTKHRYSAFVDTRLNSLLRSWGIRNLLMTGITSNVCVESTARDGFMLDYHILFLEDCTAAPDRTLHEATLTNISRFFGIVARSEEVVEGWRRKV